MQSFCIARRTLTTIDLYEGRITLLELGVLNVLRDRADISTGGWKINATALVTFCGGSVSVDQADRLLRSLEQKGYIKRWPSRRHEVYPYMVNGYFITDGVNAKKYLNADKTMEWKSPVYEAEPPMSAESHPQTDPQTHPHNDQQTLPHPQTDPQRAPQGVPQESRIPEGSGADKYISIINNNNEKDSTDIYTDGKNPHLSVDSAEEIQKQPVPVSALPSIPADNLSTPDRKDPDAEQLATVLLNALGSPKRFTNSETASRWAGLMGALIKETGLGSVELKDFIIWAVTANLNETNPKLSSAEFIPKSKDPCLTFCKHSMGSNPWLFATWDSQRKVAEKKSAKATAKAEATPEFNEGGVSSQSTYLAKLRAAKEAQYKYPKTKKEQQ